MKILNEEAVPQAFAKKILDSKTKDVESLAYEQKNAVEYLSKNVHLSHDKADKLMEELKSIEGLREDQIVAIADIAPKDKDDLRVVLTKDRFTLSEDQVNQILEIVAKYL